MYHRHWRGLVLCATFSTLLSAHVAWAAPAADFAVTEKQIQAMGINLLPLIANIQSGKASYPAKVVLPTNNEWVVSAPVNGLVSEILVEQGQKVNKGQALLRLDSPELARLQLDLLQAQNRAKLTQQTLKREEQLFKEGIIPERRWQEADSAYRDAAAVLTQAKAALVVSGMDKAKVELILRSGNLEQSLVLGARAAGIVTDISARLGMRVESASPLLRLMAGGALLLEVQLPATSAASLTVGTTLTVSGRNASAKVSSISPVVSNGQTVMVRARVDAGIQQLRAGELVQVTLPLAGASAWDLPLAAIARQGEQAYVFVRTAKGFVSRPVVVVSSGGQQVRVQGALAAGEQVAVSSVVTLKAAWLGESGGE